MTILCMKIDSQCHRNKAFNKTYIILFYLRTIIFVQIDVNVYIEKNTLFKTVKKIIGT